MMTLPAQVYVVGMSGQPVPYADGNCAPLFTLAE
jgi:hypothetical protein